jgi:hypothetical protein
MYAIGGGRVVAAEMNRKILYTAYSRTDHARTQDRKGENSSNFSKRNFSFFIHSLLPGMTGRPPVINFFNLAPAHAPA